MDLTGHVRGPLGHYLTFEQLAERGAEHPVHAAVQYEVDGAVEQGQYVHHLAVLLVAVQEERLAPEADQQREQPLRELGDQEEHENGDEHLGGAVGAALRLRHLLLGGAVLRQRIGVVAAQHLLPALRLEQRADQPEADERQYGAGEQFYEDGVDPEVDLQQTRLVLERVAQDGVIEDERFVVLRHGGRRYLQGEERGQAQHDGQAVAERYRQSASRLRAQDVIPFGVSLIKFQRIN